MRPEKLAAVCRCVRTMGSSETEPRPNVPRFGGVFYQPSALGPEQRLPGWAIVRSLRSRSKMTPRLLSGPESPKREQIFFLDSFCSAHWLDLSVVEAVARLSSRRKTVSDRPKLLSSAFSAR